MKKLYDYQIENPIYIEIWSEIQYAEIKKIKRSYSDEKYNSDDEFVELIKERVKKHEE